MNGGWIQVMGPLARIEQFKEIETTMFGGNLQQARWPPTNIADSPEEALARMVLLPGAHYSDPEFSWKFEVAPAGIGFQDGRGLGPQYDGDLFVGAARPFLEGGFLWHFNLTGNRRKIGVDDPRLADRVADNLNKPSATDPAANAQALVESESLLFGRNFGVSTDIQTGPNGNLFVVSLSDGAVYEIFRRPHGRAAERAKPGRGGKLATPLSVEGLPVGPISTLRTVAGSLGPAVPAAPPPAGEALPTMPPPIVSGPSLTASGSGASSAPAVDATWLDPFQAEKL
jgi:hypothetical protein